MADDSNPFRDIGSGLTKFLPDTILGGIGTGIGLLTTPFYALTNDSKGFKQSLLNGLVEGMDNPFIRLNDTIGQKSDEFWGADPESLTSKAMLLAEMAASGTHLARKGAMKAAKLLPEAIAQANKKGLTQEAAKAAADKVAQLTKQAQLLDQPYGLAKNFGKNMANAAITNAAFEKGIAALSDTETSDATNTALMLGAGYYGAKGLKALRNKGLKAPQTVTEKAREALPATEKVTREADELLTSLESNRKMADLYDARGFLIRGMQKAGILKNVDEETLQLLNITTEQAIADSIPIKELGNIFSTLDKDQLKYLGITLNKRGEIGHRFQAGMNNKNGEGILDKIEKTFSGEGSKVGGEAERILLLKKHLKSIGHEDLTKFDGRAGLMQLRNELMNDDIDDLVKRYPSLLKILNKEHNIKGDYSALTSEFAELVERYKLSPVYTKLRPIFDDLTEQSYKAELIDDLQRAKQVANNRRGAYAPMQAKFKSKIKDSKIQKSTNTAEAAIKDEGMIAMGLEPQDGLLALVNHAKKQVEEAKANMLKRRIMPTVESNAISRLYDKTHLMKANPKLEKVLKEYADVVRIDKQKGESLDDFHKRIEAYKIAHPEQFEVTYRQHTFSEDLSKSKGKPVAKGTRTNHVFMNRKFYEGVFGNTVRIHDDGMISKITKAINKAFMYTVTGPFVIPFLPKRMFYGNNELTFGLRKAAKDYGFDIGVMEIAKSQAKNIWGGVKNNVYQSLAEIARDTNNTFFPWKAMLHSALGNKTPEYYMSKIHDTLVEPLLAGANPVGDVIKSANGSVTMLDMLENPSKWAKRALAAKMWIDNTTPVKMMNALSAGVSDAVATTATQIIREKVSDPATQQKIFRELRKYLSTANKPGLAEETMGKFLNWVQDYIPYGKAMVQGMAAKGAVFNIPGMIKDSKQYIKDAYRFNDQKIGLTTIDVMRKFGKELATLPDDVVFNTVLKCIAGPATIAYIWNHMNAENDMSYNTMADYEKANKVVLTNFLGNGVNLAIPMDQEMSMIKNVYEAMLDSIFHLAGNDDHDYQGMLAYSIGQEMGISLPIPLEMIANAVGFKTNISPEVLLDDREKFISHINEGRYKNLNPELAEILLTTTGRFGRLLVNFAEDRELTIKNTIPFLQMNAAQSMDTESYNKTKFLQKMYYSDKQNPILKQWNLARKQIEHDKQFYERNGCTRNGEILGNRQIAEEQYNKKLKDLDLQVYEQVT